MRVVTRHFIWECQPLKIVLADLRLLRDCTARPVMGPQPSPSSYEQKATDILEIPSSGRRRTTTTCLLKIARNQSEQIYSNLTASNQQPTNQQPTNL